ncbi:hypothetical protein KMW28_14815 [Flammeovirga yaeyamensis]|uniref:Uncharacterized protein n=1 Tax=Flammeovirga yaeyamensis TaxID=367791 RepID=A0AAX1N4Y0_9BACT|nr:hypothetical protein [Flammeovirga yaeyamensis]MBB3700134.1 hypothetical protein [Flammeovirga yaeyamensis]NMF37235.1 hypothetical protein [Flammeovirga yaeyamensis]QWG00923.1 hypothetical protein KMW28_14815 [Flammeovirga yaeyamensis]
MKTFKNVIKILLTVLFFYYLKPDYGLSYNSKREELGVPVIPNDWECKGKFSWNSQKWTNNDTIEINSGNYHGFKQIQSDYGILSREIDYFYFNQNETIKTTIGVSYEYSDVGLWDIELMEYYELPDSIKKYDNEIKVIRSNKLNYDEFQSILNMKNINIKTVL